MLSVCAAKGTALSSVYEEHTLSTSGLDPGFIDHIVNLDGTEGSVPPVGIFLFIVDNGVTSVQTFKEACEGHQLGTQYPLRTPAKVQSDASDLTQEDGVLCTLLALVKENANKLEGGILLLGYEHGLKGETTRVMDNGEWASCSQQVIDLLEGAIDILSSLGQFLAKGLDYLGDDMLKGHSYSEAVMIALCNCIMGLETMLGSLDQLNRIDLPSTMRGSILHLSLLVDGALSEETLRESMNEIIEHFEEKLSVIGSVVPGSATSA